METTASSTTRPSDARSASAVVAGGSAIEAVGGIAVAVLTILALAGVIPAVLTSIAGIVFGVSLFIEGLSIAGEYTQISERASEARSGPVEFGGGVGVEVLVGLATTALGILSLIGVDAAALLPALIITGGVGLVLSAGTMQRLNDLRMMTGDHGEATRRVAAYAVTGTAVAQTLGGVAAIVLGILALTATSPFEAAGYGAMPQVGLLALGISIALSGGAVTGKMAHIFGSR